MKTYTSMRAFCAAIGCGVLVFAASAKSALAEETIVEGFVSHGALQWPEYIADSLGWFKQKGLKVEMIPVGGGAAQQLAAGALNIGYSGFPDFIRAANQGAHVKIIINGIGVPPYTIFAKPTVTSVGDLKGKVVSIGGAKDITLVYMEAVLKSAGLTSKDVDFVYAKATPDRFAALASGGVDASMLYPPFTFRAAAQGYKNLGDVEGFLKGFPFTVWAANEDWAQKHRDALGSYVAAYGRAVRWLYDPNNRQKAVDILISYSKAQPQDASDTYDYFVTKLRAFSSDGRVNQAVFNEMSDALVAMGDLSNPVPPMTTFFNTSFVDAAWNADK